MIDAVHLQVHQHSCHPLAPGGRCRVDGIVEVVVVWFILLTVLIM